MQRVRRDVLLGGHQPVVEFGGKDDPEWIPWVADRGLVLITNDKHIETRPAEAPVAIEHKLKCVHLDPHGRDTTQWQFVVQLIRHWEGVEAICAEAGPVWYRSRGPQFAPRPYQPGKPQRLPRR